MLLYTCRTLIRGLGTQVPRSSTVHLARPLGSLSRVIINATYSRSSGDRSGLMVGDTSLFKRTLRAYATNTTDTKTPTTKTARAKRATTSGRGRASTTTKKTGRTTKKRAGRKPTKRKTTTAASERAGRPKKTKREKKKKPLTDEQKTKDKIRQLKKAALVEPKQLPRTVFMVIATEIAREKHALPGKEASQRYKSLTPEELEHYNHIVNQNVAANDAAYKRWVESHSVDEIRQANDARRQLHRLLKTGSHGYKRYVLIKDQRQPKRTRGPYNLFCTDRIKSGDFKHMPMADSAPLIAREWRELRRDEKEKYEKRGQADHSRYVQEFKTVFHRDPVGTNTKKAATATTRD